MKYPTPPQGNIYNEFMLSICGSNEQTKEWRNRQSWFHGGKHNECEKYQREMIETITGTPCSLTHERISLLDHRLSVMTRPLLHEDGFEWTENFDGKQVREDGRIFYYNLKMICSDGGAQTRSLREVYHFIKAQRKCLDTGTDRIFFINILDGDTCFKHLEKFKKFVHERLFIGDLLTFSTWWRGNTAVPRALGQFYTTHYKKILTGFSIPEGTRSIIEPFAGRGDLLGFLEDQGWARADIPTRVECYDIDPKQDWIVRRDVLLDPPDFHGKFVLTNPPYLARNKNTDKQTYNRYGANDLYKCFLMQLIQQEPMGGIIIVPLNFWCSSRPMDVRLRAQFLEKFTIRCCNVFEERVFDDTSYSVCSIQFDLSTEKKPPHLLPLTVFPSQKTVKAVLEPGNDYLIGGHMHNLPNDDRFSVGRLLDQEVQGTTRILLKCIDDTEPIQLRVLRVDEPLFYDRTPKHSERSYASLVITPELSIDQQAALAARFNAFLTRERETYNSLFLSNYREDGRKRISFGLAYTIIKHLLSQEN